MTRFVQLLLPGIRDYLDMYLTTPKPGHRRKSRKDVFMAQIVQPTLPLPDFQDIEWKPEPVQSQPEPRPVNDEGDKPEPWWSNL